MAGEGPGKWMINNINTNYENVDKPRGGASEKVDKSKMVLVDVFKIL